MLLYLLLKRAIKFYSWCLSCQILLNSRGFPLWLLYCLRRRSLNYLTWILIFRECLFLISGSIFIICIIMIILLNIFQDLLGWLSNILYLYIVLFNSFLIIYLLLFLRNLIFSLGLIFRFIFNYLLIWSICISCRFI